MISVIFPTYNEAGNLKRLIGRTVKALKGVRHEIIVVDDNSPDKTWQLAQRLKRQYLQVRVVRRMDQRGLTSAINYGVKIAKGRVVGWMDADLSHPPELLPVMATTIKKSGAVVASRYLKGAEDKRELWLQVLLSRLINKLCQWLLNPQITDYTSGYILLNKRYFKKLKLEGDYGEYFIRLMADLSRLGVKIKEVPYINVNRVYGQSKTATSIWGLVIRGRKYLYTLASLCIKKYY